MAWYLWQDYAMPMTTILSSHLFNEPELGDGCDFFSLSYRMSLESPDYRAQAAAAWAGTADSFKKSTQYNCYPSMRRKGDQTAFVLD